MLKLECTLMSAINLFIETHEIFSWAQKIRETPGPQINGVIEKPSFIQDLYSISMLTFLVVFQIRFWKSKPSTINPGIYTANSLLYGFSMFQFLQTHFHMLHIKIENYFLAAC